MALTIEDIGNPAVLRIHPVKIKLTNISHNCNHTCENYFLINISFSTTSTKVKHELHILNEASMGISRYEMRWHLTPRYGAVASELC